MKPKKKTLSEVCEERLKTLTEARQEKEAAEKREKYREVEDEVMAMTYGPNWRTQLPGEKVIKGDPGEEEIAPPSESGVRLKAS